MQYSQLMYKSKNEKNLGGLEEKRTWKPWRQKTRSGWRCYLQEWLEEAELWTHVGELLAVRSGVVDSSRDAAVNSRKRPCHLESSYWTKMEEKGNRTEMVHLHLFWRRQRLLMVGPCWRAWKWRRSILDWLFWFHCTLIVRSGHVPPKV